MSQEGRIGGPLLAQDLLRNGTDLAFETSLLYLNVGSRFLGINTQGPTSDLTIGTVKNNGTTGTSSIRTTNLIATTTSIGNFTISANTIQQLASGITISPNQSSNPTIVTPGLSTSSLYFSSSTLTTTVTNDPINISPNGTGGINLANTAGLVQVNVNAGLHATGNITWDGNVILGNATTDTITFAAKVASDILPVATLNAGPSPAKQLISQNSKLFVGIDDETLLFLNPSNLVTPLSVPYLAQDGQILLAEDGSILFSNPVAPYLGSSYLYNLGSSSLSWATVYATNASIKNSITATGVVTATKLNAGNIGITGATVANNFSADPVTFSTSGSGTVRFNGSAIFVANTINVPGSGSLTVSSTGTGYTKFNDTNGIVFPVGTNLNRPASPVQGQTRFNTNAGVEEIYDLAAGGWIPIYGGATALATIDDINNDSILYAIIFGR
jgi:hypothetical protein